MGQSPAAPRAAGAPRETAPGIQAHRKAGEPKSLRFLLPPGPREAKGSRTITKKRARLSRNAATTSSLELTFQNGGSLLREPGIVFRSLGNPKKLVLPPSFLFSPNWFVNINKVVSYSLTQSGFFFPFFLSLENFLASPHNPSPTPPLCKATHLLAATRIQNQYCICHFSVSFSSLNSPACH